MTLTSHVKFEGKQTIWQIFITTLENVKIDIFMRSFCPK